MIMSRNKDIKYLHDVTGWSYKTCRQKMKDNHWDLWQALGYGEAFNYFLDKLPEIVNDIADSLKMFIDAAVDFVNSFADVIANIDISQKEIKNEQI